jgi:magnesium-dependent phosphatase 1
MGASSGRSRRRGASQCVALLLTASAAFSSALLAAASPAPIRLGRVRAPVVVRAGGTLCPRPTAPRAVGAAPLAIDGLPAGVRLPRLLVFDLDNTLWTPELYTLRHLPGYARAAPPGPRADEDVWLTDGALQVLHELASAPAWRASGVAIAVASRTNKGAWARALLSQFQIPAARGEPAVRLSSLIDHVEIREGSKLVHFEALRAASGVPYAEMLFFDDARGGPHGNCEPVSRLGVVSVHTPRALTPTLFALGLREFDARARAGGGATAVVLPMLDATDAAAAMPPPRAVVAAAAAATAGASVAVVARWDTARRFGFVRRASGGAPGGAPRGTPGGAQGGGRRDVTDVFFHARALEGAYARGVEPRVGERVLVRTRAGADGRLECESVRLEGERDAVPASPAALGGGGGGGAAGVGARARASTVRLRCFSMNAPFAPLLAHGLKRIETRNHTMFAQSAGEIVLLHCGQRTYPDGGEHIRVLLESGLTAAEVAANTALRPGFGKGQAIAIVELGQTELVESERARSAAAIEQSVCARGAAMGRYLTHIRRVEWLREGVPMRGQPGLFEAEVPRAVLPAGWLVD